MNEKSASEKNKSIKKELLQWAVILLVGGGLYFTGYHTEVIGKLQSVLLYTGLIQPDTDPDRPDQFLKSADYNMPLITLNGDPTSLNAFRGKVVFLNFWATWCPPCIAEMPNIQSLYEDIGSGDIEFVMVSLDDELEKANSFIERKGFTFPVYKLNGAKPRVYSSTLIPTTYIISSDGKIVLEHQGMANYDTDSFRAFLLNL